MITRTALWRRLTRLYHGPFPQRRTETHPAFKAEAARVEEERSKRVGKARHMLELVRANEEATLDMERKAADTTLEVGGVDCRLGQDRSRPFHRPFGPDPTHTNL